MISKPEIEDRIIRAIRGEFLKHSDEVLQKYQKQIQSSVSWYVQTLPSHIKNSEADDLASEAKIAFVDALKTWDPRRGELWSYVSIRLKGSMQDYLRRKKMDQVSGMYEWINSAAYVYMAFNREAIVGDNVDDLLHVDTALKVLDDKEKFVVENYYKKDMTFKEIGKVIGLSESQVSRICKEATRKMKQAIKSSD
ncbi:MAG TPA: sigma-70 family RNA polymerase sigma factor [Candidatus Omnitrophota bacterium]|nr:sigma-70 family RNA polymerase sigma factor [Candidatus Omnitrophota bacterium]